MALMEMQAQFASVVIQGIHAMVLPTWRTLVIPLERQSANAVQRILVMVIMLIDVRLKSVCVAPIQNVMTHRLPSHHIAITKTAHVDQVLFVRSRVINVAIQQLRQNVCVDPTQNAQ